MAYIEKLAKLIDLINADTFEDGMTTGNDMVFIKAISDLFIVNKTLIYNECSAFLVKSKKGKLDDTDLTNLQTSYEDQLQIAKCSIQTLNNLCEKYHVVPFYENDLFDDRAVMEFVNTFAHVFADARIKSHYKEKEHINEKDLTKQVENEDYMERE